jgi:MFS family permease
VRRLLLLASAVVFVDTMFYAAVTPLLPHLAREFALSKSAAGILTGSYAAGTLAGALPGGWCAARLGVRPTVLIGLGMMSAASLGFALAGNVAVLDGCRFVQGVGGAASWAGSLAWLIGAAPRGRRGELIGSAIGAAIGGALFGPALGAAAQTVGRGPAFGAVAMLGLGLMWWTLRTPAAEPAASPPEGTLIASLGDPRVVLGSWLVTLPALLFGALGVLAPLRLDALGASATAIAAAFLVAAALEGVVSPIAGRISDRRGRLGPSVAGLGCGAVVMALLPLPDARLSLIVLVIAAAPAIGLLWAPAMAMLSDGAEARGLDQGLAFALINLAWSVGALCGAVGGAWVGEGLGDAAAYLSLSALCAGTLAAVVARAELSDRGPQRTPAEKPIE